jgi:Zn finger protein HypA/HybF involved in hydrogenase expression
MPFILLWILFSVAIGAWAKAYSRSFFLWWFFSCVMTPIVGAIFLLVMGPEGRKCPKCAEMVKKTASICKHCGSALEAIKQEPEITSHPEAI